MTGEGQPDPTTAIATREDRPSLPAAMAPEAMTFREMMARAQVLAGSGIVPPALRDNAPGIVLVGVTGAELGVSLARSVQEIHVIEGRPSLSAQLRLALIRRAGHEVRWPVSTADRCVIMARRREDRDDPEAWSSVEWTIEQAKRAGLLDVTYEQWYTAEGGRKRPRRWVEGSTSPEPDWVVKARAADTLEVKRRENWHRYPAEMLRARAINAIGGMLFSDVLAGLAPLRDDASPTMIGADDVDPSAWTAPDDDEVEAELVEDDETEAETERVADEEEAVVVETGSSALIVDCGVPGCSTTTPHTHDEPVPDEVYDEDPEAGGVLPLSSQIAVTAKNAGLERADVIRAVTGGRTSSAKEVTVAEGRAVLEAIAGIAAGAFVLELGADGPILRGAGEVSDFGRDAVEDPGDGVEKEGIEVPLGETGELRSEAEASVALDGETVAVEDEHRWTAEAWRAFLNARGVKVSAALRQAAAITRDRGERGVPAPSTLDELVAATGIAAELRGWVEDQAAERSS